MNSRKSLNSEERKQIKKHYELATTEELYLELRMIKDELRNRSRGGF